MQETSQQILFGKYRNLLIGKTLSAVWRGAGSALFLEFGELLPTTRRDGAAGNSAGERSIMIEWSWRIEQGAAILCGSCSEESQWQSHFAALIGRSVADVFLVGRLPELYLSLSGGFYVASFMTADGEPGWTIFCREGEAGASRWLTVEDGRVSEQE